MRFWKECAGEDFSKDEAVLSQDNLKIAFGVHTIWRVDVDKVPLFMERFSTTIRGQLSPMYIQHEAIEAQKQMVNSPNHTVVYIPVGPMGVSHHGRHGYHAVSARAAETLTPDVAFRRIPATGLRTRRKSGQLRGSRVCCPVI